jgi:hypothetical protein
MIITPAPVSGCRDTAVRSTVCPHFADFAGDCHLLPSAI